MTFFMPSSRAFREGQMIQEKTTVSLSLRLTAIGRKRRDLALGHIVPPTLDEFQCAVLLKDGSVEAARLAKPPAG
jgi:hypothetical protein